MATNTYARELSRDVVSLTTPKKRPHRDHWILVAARDKYCDIASVMVEPDGSVEIDDPIRKVLYCDLWQKVAAMSWSRVSNWVLTFRAPYVLKQSGWIDLLNRGEIELERQRKLAGKQAGRGAVTLTSQMIELDLRIGAKKVKLLDWNNFGVDAKDNLSGLDDQDIEDVAVIFRKWIAVMTTCELSASRTSAPQIGWAKARQSFGEVNVYTSLDPAIRALERRCCYGGRCEPYRLGAINQRSHLVDIKGCYAAITSHLALPVQPMRYYPDGIDVDKIIRFDNVLWAADVVIESDYPCYPVRHFGRVVYPTGRFATSLCGVELYRAVISGHVKHIHCAASYAAFPALKGFSQWYQQSRKQLDKDKWQEMAPALKATFNSALGFFARKGREWFGWFPAGSPPWWFGKANDPADDSSVVSAHVLSGDSEFLRVGSEPRNASPIVHAVICSEARVWLWEMMNWAGRNNVFYCDTDGMIVSEDGMKSLLKEEGVFGDEYGQISARWESPSCAINGVKNYRIGSKVVCSGLTVDRQENWKLNPTLGTNMGNTDQFGHVTPFFMHCEDEGGESIRWRNAIWTN